MRRIVTTILLCIGCLTMANAQTFTQRIQQKGGVGTGTVTVTHDKAIDDLVNDKQLVPTTPTPKDATKDDKPVVQKQEIQKQEAQKQDKQKQEKQDSQKTDSEKAREQLAKILEQEDVSLDTIALDTRRKVMRGGYKITGYRVQAYAGGNQRKDRQNAERVGNTIKANFPEEPIYVHFYSPRWICRVGNYRTYEEAHQMLTNIRNLGIKGATIVKGKITVQY